MVYFGSVAPRLKCVGSHLFALRSLEAALYGGNLCNNPTRLASLVGGGRLHAVSYVFVAGRCIRVRLTGSDADNFLLEVRPVVFRVWCWQPCTTNVLVMFH